MITTFEDKTVIGRKEHRCDLCGCRIGKGERHRMQRNLFDGAFYVWREHLVCLSVANDAEVLLVEAEDWQCDAVNETYRLNCEYLFTGDYPNRILFLNPK